jgi:hypothetical protein
MNILCWFGKCYMVLVPCAEKNLATLLPTESITTRIVDADFTLSLPTNRNCFKILAFYELLILKNSWLSGRPNQGKFIGITFSVEKVGPKFELIFWKKTAESKQLPKGQNFSPSGHPADEEILKLRQLVPWWDLLYLGRWKISKVRPFKKQLEQVSCPSTLCT